MPKVYDRMSMEPKVPLIESSLISAIKGKQMTNWMPDAKPTIILPIRIRWLLLAVAIMAQDSWKRKTVFKSKCHAKIDQWVLCP